MRPCTGQKFQTGNCVHDRARCAQWFAAVRLKYRHVNQGENYHTVAMEMQEHSYRAVIPEEYTESEFGLQYYFELDGGTRGMTMYPGLGPDLTGQPYFVVQQA